MSMAIMVQGTTSDAGKSFLVAGLCRYFANQGQRVAPFKPQNMALNSAVTEDGGEIGRAQALQAQACRLAPHTDMNPVLLKPETDTGAQVIIHGHPIAKMEATTYHDYKTTAFTAVMESYKRLQSQYDIVCIEGAGSPAEINLRDRDIANMGFAEPANCPVILVADIDKGGVFAHLVGTLDLLSETEQARVVGFVINKFRGDIALLQSGLDWLEAKTGKPVLGVIPYLPNFYLDAEDAISITQVKGSNDLINIVVPVLPRISNHTDFDSLRLHPQVNLEFIDITQPLPSCELVILPGSKSVRADLEQLINHQWQSKLDRHLRYGGKVMGICGGYQMLGQLIADPTGAEGSVGETAGFRYLPVSTTLAPHKTLTQVSGSACLFAGTPSFPVSGYEIHCGITAVPADMQSFIKLDNNRNDGLVSADNQILGTYLHGIFDQAEACNALLSWAGLTSAEAVNMSDLREQQLNRIAETIALHIDMNKLTRLAEKYAT